jgi:hypothetical protein
MTTILSKEEVERIKQSAINAGLESPQPGSYTLSNQFKSILDKDTVGKAAIREMAEAIKDHEFRVIKQMMCSAPMLGVPPAEIEAGTIDAEATESKVREATGIPVDPCAPVEIAEVPEEAGRKPASPLIAPGSWKTGEWLSHRLNDWKTHIAPEEERRLTSLAMARVRAVPFCDECQRPRVAKLNLDTCRIEWVCEEVGR